jgi:pSer/pThr/pTyr-binding forkhead associated (FHA) protein
MGSLGVATRAEEPLKLIIEDDEGRKTVVPFSRDEITVGRQEGNTIRLTERNVSRRHARLLRQDAQVLVEDLGSYNGIKVNGEKIAGQVEIKDGDLVQIGDYDLAIQRDEPLHSPPTEPTPAVPTAMDDESLPEPRSLAGSPADATTPASGTPTASYANDARRHATAVIRIDKLANDDHGPVEDVPLSEAPRLVVLNTEFSGREFACVRTELRVGRAEDNDISLDHRSLSREHIKLRRSANGEWRVVDLGSANGVSVNGESYATTALRSGDIIQLGHVKFRFMAAGEKAGPRRARVSEETSSGPSKAVVGAIVGTVVLAGVGVVAMLTRDGGEKPTLPPAPVVVVDTSGQKLEEARTALARGSLELAAKRIEEARTPDGRPAAGAEQVAQQVESERAHKERLASAERAVQAGELDEAAQLLAASELTSVFKAELARVKGLLAEARTRAQVKVEPTPAPDQARPRQTPPPRQPEAQPQQQAKDFYEEGKKAISDKKYDAAEAAFKRCVKIAPTMAECHKGLGAAYARMGKSDEGARSYREYLRLAPDAPDAAKLRTMLEQYEKQPR